MPRKGAGVGEPAEHTGRDQVNVAKDRDTPSQGGTPSAITPTEGGGREDARNCGIKRGANRCPPLSEHMNKSIVFGFDSVWIASGGSQGAAVGRFFRRR